MQKIHIGALYRVDLNDDPDFGKIVRIISIDAGIAHFRTQEGISGLFHVGTVFANALTRMEETMYTPEQKIEPPDDGYYITADCGHEVYEGETIVTFAGKTLCPDCFHDRVAELTITEVAAMMGCDYKEVTA